MSVCTASARSLWVLAVLAASSVAVAQPGPGGVQTSVQVFAYYAGDSSLKGSTLIDSANGVSPVPIQTQ